MNFITKMKLGVLIAFASVLSIAGCSKAAREENEMPDMRAASASAAQSMSSQVMLPAPDSPADFVVPAISVGPASTSKLIDFGWSNGKGDLVQLSNYAKGKIIVVNFWATWCPPCRKEIPDLVEVAKTNPDVAIVGVALERDQINAQTGVKKFANDKGINYLNVVSTASFNTQDISAAYGSINPIDFIPMTFIFNKAGNHVATISGGTTKEALLDAIKKAM